MTAGLLWTPDRQTFWLGCETFGNDGAVLTHPSHDLCHLILGLASRGLEWRPVGVDERRRLAEYNAYLLEHVLERALLDPASASVVLDVLPSLRHFVGVYYAPFEVPAEELYRRWCAGVDLRGVLALAPCYLTMRTAELADPGYRDRAWRRELGPCLSVAPELRPALAALERGLAAVLA